MIPPPKELSELQNLLYGLVVSPNGVEEGLAAKKIRLPGLDAVIAGGPRLSSRARLEIYANAYFYRILEILKEEFSATLRITGDIQFHNLVTGYLIEYPPTEPSVYYAGQHFPRYLCDSARGSTVEDRIRFVGELALLERAILEVFHAADASPLEPASMRSIAPHEWPALMVRAHPTLRLTDLQWEIAPLLRAIQEGASWQPPAARHNTVLVWRSNCETCYREVSVVEALALTHARDRISLAAVCEEIAQNLAPDVSAEAGVHEILSRWFSDGLLCRA